MRGEVGASNIPTAPAGVRIRARILGMRVSQPWLGWAEQDVCARTWPIWRGLAVTLWGAAGLLLALVVFWLGGEPVDAGMALSTVGVYSCVIVLAVVFAHTESGRRIAIERLRRGWRAQPWSLAVTLLVLAWLVVWFLFLRPGV